MFPMGPNNNPMMPAMMGVIAGQQAMQRAAQEEQTAALEEQNRLLNKQTWWLKWQDPSYQQVVAASFDAADDLARATWIWQNFPQWDDDQQEYALRVLSEHLPDMDITGTNVILAKWLDDAQAASIRNTNTNKPRRKGWFRK